MVDSPLLVLGVRRSGTTLLRVILDRSSQLAIPDESYFVPQIADRHRRAVDVDRFVDDLRRLPTLRDWGVEPQAVRGRLRPGCGLGEAIAAVYEVYAAEHGKPRWGDKTPMYMGHLDLLERLFPRARYLHLIRDGRDAALSFLSMPSGIMTEGWGHPRDAAGFACQWRTEVAAARTLGRRVGAERYREIRYEDLVAEPEQAVREICAFAVLPWEPAMLAYPEAVDVTAKPHQQSLRRAPTPGLRSWRDQMPADDVAAFEAVAGDLLSELGYGVLSSGRSPDAASRRRLVAYRTKAAAWRAAGTAVRRSPLWRRRHPYLA